MIIVQCKKHVRLKFGGCFEDQGRLIHNYKRNLLNLF
jgi:hypothetical protein